MKANMQLNRSLPTRALTLVAGLAFSLLTTWSVEVLSAPITTSDTYAYQFLDNVSPNANGLFSGQRQQLGSVCVVLAGNPCFPQNSANAIGTSGIAEQNGVSRTLSYIASDLTSNHWAGLAPLNLTGPWTLKFTNGGNLATSTTPGITGTNWIDTAHAASILLNGNTPTFNWNLPTLAPGTSIDAVAVNIRDTTDFRGANGVGGNGSATIIYRAALGASATSLTIQPNDPRFLIDSSTGQRFALQSGRQYSLEIQLQDTRNNASGGGFPNVLSQSRTFVDFSLQNGNLPGQYYLPIVDTSGPVPVVFGFNNIPVTTGQTIYIDPVVATGFDYQIGADSPNFRSVTLPTGIGDNLFDLWLWSGTDWFDTGNDILGGQEFMFGTDGIDLFRITGIETEAFVDPYSPTAFVTGLSFVRDGNFTGTMTPITAEIPEPASIILTALGLLGLAGLRRRPV